MQAGGHRFDPDRLHQIRFDRQAHDVGLAVQPDEDFDIVQRDTTSVSPVSRVGEDLGFDPAGDIVPSLVQLTAMTFGSRMGMYMLLTWERALLFPDQIKREKGVWWMPRQQEAMKDVIPCVKPWGAGNGLRSMDVRMGKPT